MIGDVSFSGVRQVLKVKRGVLIVDVLKVSQHGQTNTMESMRSNGNGTKPGVPFDD